MVQGFCFAYWQQYVKWLLCTSRSAYCFEEAARFEKVLQGRAGPVAVIAHFEAMEVDGQKRLMVALNDITDRKRAEDTLRESEERFRLLVENSNELVLQVAPDGTILYASPNHAVIDNTSPWPQPSLLSETAHSPQASGAISALVSEKKVIFSHGGRPSTATKILP